MGTRILLDSASLDATARVMADAAASLDDTAAAFSQIAASVPDLEPLLDSAAFTLRRVALETSIDAQDLARRATCCCEVGAGGLSLPALASSAVGLAAWGGPAPVAVAVPAPATSDAPLGGTSWLDNMDAGSASAPATPESAGWVDDMVAERNAEPVDLSGYRASLAASLASMTPGITVGNGAALAPGTQALNNSVFNATFGGLHYGDGIMYTGIDHVDPIKIEEANIQYGARGPDYGTPTLIGILHSTTEVF
jgi:hypothetical protein